ncbi:MAG: SH3 domain-containing protein [Chloroflexi bacterium]|nr:SH3 domain-containing protein [Chloroflexota bacterium]
MSDQNVANNWRLEDTGETQDRWKLQEAEQGLVTQWQLQDEPRPEAAWQPVDYTRERPGPGNWVLPALVVVALVAVVGYIAWIGLTRFNLLTTTTPTDAAQTPAGVVTSVADANTPAAIAANTEVTQTAAPTVAPTEPAPTAVLVPTPAPTPTVARVEQEFISVSDPAGVNARSEPNATSAVVKLLEAGQRVLVVTQEQDWIQVALARNSLAWVKAEFVDRSSQLVSLDEANQRRVELGLTPLASAPAPSAATGAVTGTIPSTLTVGVTSTTGVTGVAGITNPLTTEPLLVSTPLTATINISTGLNARSVPTTTGTPIKLLTNSARYKVTGRSADNQWLQIVLEDGAPAWVFAEYVNVNGNTNTLPVPSSSTALTTTGTISNSTGAVVTTTTSLSGTTGTAGGEATLTVSSLSGANARPAPDRAAASLTLFPFEAALPVVGRTADNQWLQVRLNDGSLGWMLTSAVKLSVDIATVRVVNP